VSAVRLLREAQATGLRLRVEDGQASCLPCYYEAAAKRAVLSPDVLADPAELTASGEPLP
jgi:hypothetical protein